MPEWKGGAASGTIEEAADEGNEDEREAGNVENDCLFWTMWYPWLDRWFSGTDGSNQADRAKQDMNARIT